MIKAFNNLTGRNYQYRQLKNKWSSLKKDWQLWNTLIGKETGLGWDPMRQTINASNEWWDKKLKMFCLFIKFIWLIYILIIEYGKLDTLVRES